MVLFEKTSNSYRITGKYNNLIRMVEYSVDLSLIRYGTEKGYYKWEKTNQQELDRFNDSYKQKFYLDFPPFS